MQGKSDILWRISKLQPWRIERRINLILWYITINFHCLSCLQCILLLWPISIYLCFSYATLYIHLYMYDPGSWRSHPTSPFSLDMDCSHSSHTACSHTTWKEIKTEISQNHLKHISVQNMQCFLTFLCLHVVVIRTRNCHQTWGPQTPKKNNDRMGYLVTQCW